MLGHLLHNIHTHFLLSLFQIVDRNLDQFNVSILQFVSKPVLERVNISDGFQDDVQLGHIVLGRHTGHQLFQPEINMVYKNENEMLRC